jgi:hypothetical protein
MADIDKKPRPQGMIVIPWVTEEVPLVFSDKEQLLPRVRHRRPFSLLLLSATGHCCVT